MTSLQDMLKATALVRGGRLSDATSLIRTLLKTKAPAAAGAAEPNIAAPENGRLIDFAPSPETGSWTLPEAPRAKGEADEAGRRRSGFAAKDFSARRSPRFDARRHGGAAPKIPDGASFSEHSCACPQGLLNYKLYVPSRYVGAPLPLIVMLHGCTQSPDDFAAGTQMNAAAEERNAFVAYPEQPQSANASKCWNWFRGADQQRERGEPAMIAAVTRQIMARYAVAPDRVFIAGLSAGGAAAANLGAAYPDLYAAIGVHSGLACGAARDLPSAMAAMRSGGSPSPVAIPGRPLRAIVFHGDRDSTVNPVNSDYVLAQCEAEAWPLATRIVEGKVPGGLAYTRTLRTGAEGAALFEKWVIHGAGHAWSGGSADGSYTEPRGPDASREMLRFFLDAEPPPR